MGKCLHYFPATTLQKVTPLTRDKTNKALLKTNSEKTIEDLLRLKQVMGVTVKYEINLYTIKAYA